MTAWCKRLTSRVTLGSVLLHVDMGVQVVEGAIALLALAPVTDIQALNLIEPATGTLLGVDTREWNERVHLVAVLGIHVASLGHPRNWLACSWFWMGLGHGVGLDRVWVDAVALQR